MKKNIIVQRLLCSLLWSVSTVLAISIDEIDYVRCGAEHKWALKEDFKQNKSNYIKLFRVEGVGAQYDIYINNIRKESVDSFAQALPRLYELSQEGSQKNLHNLSVIYLSKR